MTAPLTRQLGRFVSALRYDSLPKAALDAVRTGFTDCIAVMQAGIDERVRLRARGGARQCRRRPCTRL